MNTWIPNKFHYYSTSLSKVTVRFISQHLLSSQYTIPLQTFKLSQWASDVHRTSNGRLHEIQTSYRGPLDV